jgi:hypothetical protein
MALLGAGKAVGLESQQRGNVGIVAEIRKVRNSEVKMCVD